MRKKLCMLLVIALMGTLGSEKVYAYDAADQDVWTETLTVEQMDEVFRIAHVPEQEIQKMDAEMKSFIIQNSGKNIEYVEVTKIETAASPYSYSSEYEISEDDLMLTVLAFKTGDQLDIYPSYEWLTPVKPKGKDYFGYSVSSSYSAVPGKRSNLSWAKMEKTDSWINEGPMTYTGTSLYGYEHSGSTLGTPDFAIYIKGCCYYRVDILSQNPDKKIVLSYVHDLSFGSSFSYGISYGPASISVRPSSTKVGYQNNVYALKY